MAVVLDPTRSFVSLITYYKDSIRGVRVVKRPDVTTKALTTFWKRMTWKEQNIIFSHAIRIVGEANEIDNIKYREMKLKTCLKKWDAKDDDGNDIPLNDQSIENLDPLIASSLLKQFEEATEPSNDDLKKLEEVTRRFYDGKKPLSGVLPQYIYEHVLAKQYGWSLAEIRDMDYCDFLVHLRLCLVADGKDKEFELTAHGFGKKKATADDILRKKAEEMLGVGKENVVL